jgi:hypothetical protein
MPDVRHRGGFTPAPPRGRVRGWAARYLRCAPLLLYAAVFSSARFFLEGTTGVLSFLLAAAAVATAIVPLQEAGERHPGGGLQHLPAQRHGRPRPGGLGGGEMRWNGGGVAQAGPGGRSVSPGGPMTSQEC